VKIDELDKGAIRCLPPPLTTASFLSPFPGM
jgi:hypothetical protein